VSGLVGWVDYDRDLTREHPVIKSMTETMRARGPAYGGTWVSRRAALGHRQAVPLDPESGRPPVEAHTETGPVVAAGSGWISNADELRRELRAFGVSFTTRTDGEVLLRSFLHWGDEFAERLRGMYAFAIWDARESRLLLGRDRLGVKPLYYYEYSGGILFASEPKGVMANPLFEARLDLSAVPILLQPRLALPGETPLAGLREVPPAHVAAYSAAGLRLRPYWRLVSAPHRDSFEDTVHRVRELLEDAVGQALVADAPFGAMLSGGIDSTSVAALGTRALRDQHPGGALDTFCLRFERDADHFVATELRPEIDAPFAADAAAFLGSRHRTVTASVSDLLDAIPATRRARDLPGWGQFDASMYLLFREMSRHCTVALSGEAADELFGGYPYFFKPEVFRRAGFPWLGDGPRLSDYLSPEILLHVDPREDERRRYDQLLAEVPRLDGESPEETRMREVFYLGLSGPLAVILDRKDRMSMAHGLEVRIPFCDHRLVEYVWNVPWSMKASGGVKGLLKAATADLLPAGTLRRQKSAYPHVQDPDHDRWLVREVIRLAEDHCSPVAYLFDADGVRRLVANLGAVRPGAAAGRSFPGGASPVYMLVHLVEVNQWIKDYRVSIR
jgi:asparagine synthase (glutamine-hydrolysing)/putative beta-lactam synthetase